MSSDKSKQREHNVICKIIGVSTEVSKPGVVFLKDLAAQLAKDSLLHVSVADLEDLFVGRLSAESSTESRIGAICEIFSRGLEEGNKPFPEEFLKRVILPVQKMTLLYLLLSLQCPELFGEENELDSGMGDEDSIFKNSKTLALLAESNKVPMSLLSKFQQVVLEEGGEELLLQVFTPIVEVYILKMRQRSLDYSELYTGELNALCLLMKVLKNSPLIKLITNHPFFLPPLPVRTPLPASSQMPTVKGENVFSLQSSSILGGVLRPNPVDHHLLTPDKLPKAPKKTLFPLDKMMRPTIPWLRGQCLQLRTQVSSQMEQTLSFVNPLLRGGEGPRLACLKWIGKYLTGGAPRATIGLQDRLIPHPQNLIEQLEKVPQLNHSVLEWRQKTQGLITQFCGLPSTGVALNLAWTIFELCRPIKLQSASSIEILYFVSSAQDAEDVIGKNLREEGKIGDAERVSRVSTEEQGSFKSQIFWQSVNAVHSILVPTLKEANLYAQAQAILYHNKGNQNTMADAWGEFLCLEGILFCPKFIESLAHALNLQLGVILKSASEEAPGTKSGPGKSQSSKEEEDQKNFENYRKHQKLDLTADKELESDPSSAYRNLNILDPKFSSDDISDSFAVLPSVMLDNIVEVLEFYKQMPPDYSPAGSVDIFSLLDADHFLLFLILILGSDRIRDPNIRGKAAKVLMDFSKKSNFFSRIESAPFCTRNILPACVRVFTAVEKTKQSYYDIRMHVKFDIRIPIQQLFEKVLPIEEHTKFLRVFAKTHSDEFCKFVSQLLNDTTYLLEEGIETLLAIRKKEKEGETLMQSGARESSRVDVGGADLEEGEDFDGTAGLGVSRDVDDEDIQENGEDIYRRSRHDPKKHCQQYMKMGNQTVSTLHAICKQACQVLTDDKVVLEQMVASCLDACLDRLVGPNCLQLKHRQGKVSDFELYNFDPKGLLAKLVEMYVLISRHAKEKLIKIISDDQRYYRPRTFRKAGTICRREGIVSPNLCDEFEQFVKELVEVSEQRQSALDSVDIPDEYLDPIMAEIMTDPVLLPSSKNIMDRKHIMRIILSDDHDPFNRSPLKTSDLVPQTELKKEILDFCRNHKIELLEEDE